MKREMQEARCEKWDGKSENGECKKGQGVASFLHQ